MDHSRLAVALGAGLFVAGAVWASTTADTAAAPAAQPYSAVVVGTVHQALFAIDFDGERGLAVGAAGEIQASRDQGRSWAPVLPAPTQLALLGVDLEGKRALAVGQDGLILRRDGDAEAAQWVQAESATRNRLFAVAVNAEGAAITVGAFGSVLMSADGGRSWRSVAPVWADIAVDGMEPHLYAAEIDDAGVVTIAGEFGLILRSANGGADWQVLHKGDASLFDLQLRADGTGFAVGQSGAVLRSRDGGASWTALDSGSEALLLSVHAEPGGRVVATAMRDMLFSHDEGNSWQRIDAPEIRNAWFAGLAQADARDAPVLAVGQAGQIVRLDP